MAGAGPGAGRLLEAQLFRRPLHLGGQVVPHLLKAALQQADRLGNGLVVLLPQVFRAAVAVALAMWKFRQGRSFPMSRGNFFRQEGQAQSGAQGIDDGLGGVAAGIGAEVPGPVLRRPGGQGKAGVGLVGQADIGVALVVLQEDVVPGLVPLDEGALQHQGLDSLSAMMDVEVVDLGHHGPGLLGVEAESWKYWDTRFFRALALPT